MAQRFEHEVVDSTQAEAIALARLGSEVGTVVVAKAQRGGVGRLDRHWDSPAGGLYLSVLSELPRDNSGLLPLAIAAELRTALVRAGVAGLKIKWPNDLVADDDAPPPRKLSGILIDRIARRSGSEIVVVGIGVNVRRGPVPLGEDVAARAVFLEDLASSAPGPDRVEAIVLGAVASAVRRLNDPDGARSVVEECRRHLYGVGRSVRVDGSDVGILRSLEADGSVTVEQGGTFATFHAGDLAVEVRA